MRRTNFPVLLLWLAAGASAALPSAGLAADAQAAQAPAPFAEEIGVFGVEDEVYPPKGCETLFVGSSSFRFWFNLKQDFHPLPIIKRGFGGAQIADINHYFDKVVGRYRPKRIVFYAGENDIAAGKSPAAATAEFQAFLDRKTAVLGSTPVFFVSAKPSFARQDQFAAQSDYNRSVAALARGRSDLIYVDIVTPMMRGGLKRSMFISDGLHMNASGYAIWRSVIGTAIRTARTSHAPGCG